MAVLESLQGEGHPALPFALEKQGEVKRLTAMTRAQSTWAIQAASGYGRYMQQARGW